MLVWSTDGLSPSHLVGPHNRQCNAFNNKVLAEWLLFHSPIVSLHSKSHICGCRHYYRVHQGHLYSLWILGALEWKAIDCNFHQYQNWQFWQQHRYLTWATWFCNFLMKSTFNNLTLQHVWRLAWLCSLLASNPLTGCSYSDFLTFHLGFPFWGLSVLGFSRPFRAPNLLTHHSKML